MAITPPTPLQMDKLKSKILQPSLTSTFLVQINLPGNVKSFIQKRVNGKYPIPDYENINLSCCDASLPGSSLATHEITNDYTGVTERHVYRRIYDDRSDFTFYVDQKYDAIRTFESWINYIVGEGEYFSSDDYETKINLPYRVKYPDDYRSNIYITKFEKENQQESNKINYTFVGAYPISITSIPVSYNSSELLKCTVSFTYLRYVAKASNFNYQVPIDRKRISSNSTSTSNTPTPEQPSNFDPNQPGLFDRFSGPINF